MKAYTITTFKFKIRYEHLIWAHREHAFYPTKNVLNSWTPKLVIILEYLVHIEVYVRELVIVEAIFCCEKLLQ